MWNLTIRWTGWLMIAGMVLFLVGAALWGPGYNKPDLAGTLRYIAERPRSWIWIHAWFVLGVTTTTVAIGVWTEVQRKAGDSLATPIAFGLYTIGAVLWLVAIGLRLTVQHWAAAEVLRTEQVPSFYPPFHRLAGGLYSAHMVLSYLTAVTLGWGILRTGVLSGTLGKVGLIGGAVFAVGFAALGGGPFSPPFLAHLFTFIVGIALLRRPPQLDAP